MINAERFWKRVDRSDGFFACWTWTAFRNTARGGVGHFNVDGQVMRAPRVAWELVNGAIPRGLFVCHHCDNPSCCNPAHLFLGTAADNMRDAVAKGRMLRRLTPAQCTEIYRRRAEGEGVRALAREFGVDHSRVSRLTRRPDLLPLVNEANATLRRSDAPTDEAGRLSSHAAQTLTELRQAAALVERR